MGETAVEVGEQLAPVAEPGERVGRGEHGSCARVICVLAERQERASDHGDDRRRGERDADHVPVLEVAVDEDPERDQAADAGGRAERPALELHVGCRRRGAPCGECEQQERRRPEGVENRSRRVCRRRTGRGRGASASAESASAAPIRAQPRPGRQPVIPKTATTSASSTMSPSGYARFTASGESFPCVRVMTTSSSTAAPTEATVSDGGDPVAARRSC